MRIRELSGPDDPLLPPVLDLYRRSFDEASRDPDEDLLQDASGSGSYSLIVLDLGGSLGGFVRWTWLPEADSLFVIHLAVSEEHRCRGFGAALLGEVLETKPGKPVLLEVDPGDPSHAWWTARGARTVTPLYTQPALHPHTDPVPYHLIAIGSVADPRALVKAFYREVWGLSQEHPFVQRALEGC